MRSDTLNRHPGSWRFVRAVAAIGVLCGVLWWLALGMGRGQPASAHSSAPAESAAPLAPGVVITITSGGFVPAVVTTATGVQVNWYNATTQIQILESGTPARVYLPLIVRGGGS